MQLTKDIEIIDLALHLKKENTLIIADTHIGYEESLNKSGVLIPPVNFKEIVKRLKKILNKTKKLNKIIINGDIKHEFGQISDTEWRNTKRLIDLLKSYSKEIILIKGNHDKILGPIADKWKVQIEDYIVINNTLIIHGDTIPKIDKNIKTIIIGHEHPAITIADNARTEKFKCFLYGKFKKRNLIVQPSLNLLTEGTDMLKEERISPFLQNNIHNFNVYIVADKIYSFGKLKCQNFPSSL